MKLPPNETNVTAKRAGWNGKLTPAQAEDLDPYDHEDDDLRGELQWFEVPAHDEWLAVLVCRVNKQPADPETVKPVK